MREGRDCFDAEQEACPSPPTRMAQPSLLILFSSLSAQNFMASIFEAQYGRKLVLPDGNATPLGEMMDHLNLFFTVYFAVELVINAYAHWLRSFVANGWNHLDVFIVFISLFDAGMPSVPTWLVQLMRAFRVIRLFGRVRTLKKMTSAVTASIIPMMNAFVILLIVISICGSNSLSCHPSQPCISLLASSWKKGFK
jgi:hypothetical protein